MTSEAPKHYSESIGEWSWRPGDGPVPGMYARKPAGSRWFAGCRWRTGAGNAGVLEASQVEGPPETMEWRRMWLEITDLIAVEKQGWERLAKAMMGASEDVEPENRAEINELLAYARSRYAEYLAPWCRDELRQIRLFLQPIRLDWGPIEQDVRAWLGAGVPHE